jgi:hypothetical protein
MATDLLVDWVRPLLLGSFGGSFGGAAVSLLTRFFRIRDEERGLKQEAFLNCSKILDVVEGEVRDQMHYLGMGACPPFTAKSLPDADLTINQYRVVVGETFFKAASARLGNLVDTLMRLDHDEPWEVGPPDATLRDAMLATVPGFVHINRDPRVALPSDTPTKARLD